MNETAAFPRQSGLMDETARFTTPERADDARCKMDITSVTFPPFPPVVSISHLPPKT